MCCKLLTCCRLDSSRNSGSSCTSTRPLPCRRSKPSQGEAGNLPITLRQCAQISVTCDADAKRPAPTRLRSQTTGFVRLIANPAARSDLGFKKQLARASTRSLPCEAQFSNPPTLGCSVHMREGRAYSGCLLRRVLSGQGRPLGRERSTATMRTT